uniref:PORR domain-containing protein n=1 Tax=Nelumbo nucifera TaxID=4432 RepID=A0A822XYT0_NELNU|nr:TPA_asm: hypothetical protein HUJ06_026646 [Nelumbo nucifera]
MEEKNLIIDRPPKFNRVKLPKGLNLSKGEMRRIWKFREIPYISPYSDFSGLKAGTPEKEKHACEVVYDILSFTVEKRTLVDHLTHFREEFKFSQQLRGMLIRHPDMFYVSLKGDRGSVFLREAYRDSQLIDKDRLLIIKENMNMDGSEGAKGADNSEVESDEGVGEWSDVDNLLGNEFGDDEFDDYNDDEDEWSDEDDDMPPDFDGVGGSRNFRESELVNEVEILRKNEERVPVFPDGRPRECW